MKKRSIIDSLASQVNTVKVEELLAQAFDAGQAYERHRLQTAVAPSLNELTSSLNKAEETLVNIMKDLPE
ncbi:MAG: hypothetical protein NUW00_04510 [Candidatus Kaiserbacteria bacterium]|nr:hypothetical protein [Candidatus Kaiserbacteria bacterium]